MVTKTYRDALNNPPLMDILSFIPMTTVGAIYIKVFKRVDEDDPSQDIEIDRTMLFNRVTDWYPYYHIIFNAERSTNYVISYENNNGDEMLTPANRISAVNYYPPIPVQSSIIMNQARTGAEALRRLYIVLERMGEKSILLRKKRSGTRCSCWRDQDRKALPSCSDCYGTGWIGGFDVFYPFLMDPQPAGERVKLTNIGLTIDTQPRAWGVIVPKINDGDFIIRLYDELHDRYEINNPIRKDKDGIAGIPTIQEFSLYLHSSDHPIYKFPVENFVSDYVKPTNNPSLPVVR